MIEILDGLRWFQGKRLVSTIRGSDYAHAGEEEAIIKCLEPFQKDSSRLVLDAGCGQGGTAHYIQKSGWGKVTGFDIESDSIEYAKIKYSDITFKTFDIDDVEENSFNEMFNLICLFNSYYAFKDQENALNSLYKIAEKNCDLVIFDYTDLSTDKNNPLIVENNPKSNFTPIKLSTIENSIKKSGWSFINIKNLDKEYEIWYESLLELIFKNKNIIIEKYGENGYSKAVNRYSNIYNAIREKILGGCILYARRGF